MMYPAEEAKTVAQEQSQAPTLSTSQERTLVALCDLYARMKTGQSDAKALSRHVSKAYRVDNAVISHLTTLGVVRRDGGIRGPVTWVGPAPHPAMVIDLFEARTAKKVASRTERLGQLSLVPRIGDEDNVAEGEATEIQAPVAGTIEDRLDRIEKTLDTLMSSLEKMMDSWGVK